MNTVSGVLLILAGAGAAALFGFWWWRRSWLKALDAGSRVAQTSRGPIAYAVEGHGPVLLYFHGTLGGYDQGLVAGRFINGPAPKDGFTILAPSRPGYLRTPLETGRTPEEQADAMAALLDHLGIDQVAVMGGSGGAPFALQFALRHPHRTSALIMFSAITHRIPAHKRTRVRQRLLASRAGRLLLDLFLSTLLHLTLRFRTRSLAWRVFRGMTARTVPASDIHKRVETMWASPDQVRIFQGIVRCMLPLSVRMTGVLNDEKQIALLPEYPLECIRTPTLILHGSEDAVAPASHVTFLTDKIAGAEVYRIERCGHFLWVGEHSQPMRSMLVDFLRRHAAISSFRAFSQSP